MCDNFMHADVDGNGSVGFEDINPFVDLTTYGNAGAARTYTWDAANRLSAVAPALDASLLTADHRRVEFAYDYRNRMIAKQTYAWNPNATPAATWELSAQRKFVWSGWLLLLELDGLNSDAVVRKYTWGLDLAGLNGGGSSGNSPAFLEAAGGIGGLLATKNEPGGPATHAALTYDANGNVTQAFKWSTTDPNQALVAHYEYDPYGNRINEPAQGEYDQPFRFSTKMYDPVSELLNFGERHYSSALGRWVNRDPIEEEGGENLYAFVRNRPISLVDWFGRQDSDPTTRPAAKGCCGPDVSRAVQEALDAAENWFLYRLSNAGKSDVCMGLWNSDSGWDIYDLASTGGGDEWAPPKITSAGCGTGDCEGSVQYGGGCYRAGELNYILYGLANRMCNDTARNWSHYAGTDDSGQPVYRDYRGRRVYRDMWRLDTMILTILGYRAAQGLGILPRKPSAPVGPGGTLCRVGWAAHGYGVWPPPESCKVKGCGTSCCDKEYEGSKLTVRLGGYNVP